MRFARRGSIAPIEAALGFRVLALFLVLLGVKVYATTAAIGT